MTDARHVLEPFHVRWTASCPKCHAGVGDLCKGAFSLGRLTNHQPRVDRARALTA